MFQFNGVLYFQLNLGISPKCEQFYRQQGYDFKLSNGRIVLVRRTPRSARPRRQEQVGHLENRLTHKLLPAALIPQRGLFPSHSAAASLWTRATPCRSSPVRGRRASPSPGPDRAWSGSGTGRVSDSSWTTSPHPWITSWSCATSQRSDPRHAGADLLQTRLHFLLFLPLLRRRRLIGWLRSASPRCPWARAGAPVTPQEGKLCSFLETPG